MRAEFFWCFVAPLAIFVVLSVNAAATDWEPWSGGSTPALALKNVQGETQSLQSWKGKVVIVNFWATWCEPCIEEMPSLQKLKDGFAGEAFEVIGVNLAEGVPRITSFTARTGVTFPILLDSDGVVKKAWKIKGVPATYLLDGSGRIRFSHVGLLDFSDPKIVARVSALIEKNKEKNKK